MQTIKTETYGIPFSLTAPSTKEEIDTLMQSAGATERLAVDHLLAHTVLAKIRSSLADKLISLGATLEEGAKADKKWFAAAFAALDLDQSARIGIVQEIADATGFDVTSSRGKGGGPSQEDLKTATGAIDAIGAGQSTFARVVEKLEARNPGLSIPVEDDGTVTVDNLASAIRTDRLRRLAEVKAGSSLL